MHAAAIARRINLRAISPSRVGVALDETVTEQDLDDLIQVFGVSQPSSRPTVQQSSIPDHFRRTTPYLTHPVFRAHRSETEMLRYIRKLESRDLSLTAAMIPLGSCTMKLNATAEMVPVSWPGFGRLHPFAPRDQADGYRELFADLESWLAEITGFAKISLQPNAGSQGEFAGLLVIRAYHKARGEAHRTVCLIPQSAHGTNPASAVMAGMKVVVV
jgi:glycine dehydrogenase